MKNNFSNSYLAIIKNFRHKSLFFRYAKSLAIIVLVPFLVINIIFYNYLTNSHKEKTKQLINERFLETENRLEAFFSDVNSVYHSLSNDYYSSQYFSEYIYSEKYPHDVNIVSRNINSIYTSILRDKYVISSIELYSEKNNYILMEKSGCFMEQYENPWWISHYRNKETCFIRHDNNLISFGYTFYTSENTPSGALIINISENNMKHYLQLTENEEIFIFRRSTPNINIPIEIINTIDINEKRIISDKVNTYTLFPTNDNDIEIIIKFDSHSTFNSDIFIYMLIIIIFTFLAVIIIAFIGSAVFYRSIANIIALLESSSVAPEDVQKKEYNEIIYLENSIIKLINNDKKIEEQLVEKIKNIKKYQTIALQSQINPHFLFNTLNLINTELFSIFKKTNNITKIVTLLSDIIYSSLSVSEYIIPLSEEIEYVKKYAEILNLRYENLFDIVWNIDENCKNMPVLKMILQPILENAVEHGILLTEDETRGIIAISAYKKSGILYLSVKNNGRKISADKLTEIRENIKNHTTDKKRHIGLGNIDQRIKLIYGEDYGVSIESHSDTTVTITLPNLPEV